ncbi:MAG: tetratricopeptide repeat protein [Bacteroidetes bacterium]|nr:tetratricopeptide repeat protein [Bacteroidales bacterium]NJO68174.1 tetratricopeptide repeat protein [Bacteroidota bacterium]
MKFNLIAIILVSIFQLNYAQIADKNLIKAGMLVHLELYDQALEAANQSQSSDDKFYPVIMAEINFGIKDFSKALEFYKEAENNFSGEFHLEKAKCFAMLGNKNLAFENLSEYIKTKNKLPVSKIANDAAFQSLKDNLNWGKLWQNADYSDLEIKINQTEASLAAGYQNNFPVLDEALKKYPNNPELLYQQARYLSGMKLYDAALKSINQAITRKPGMDKYQFQKAEVLLKLQNFKDALVAINNAISKNPFSHEYYIIRIDINQNLGNSEKSAEDMALLEYSLPDNPNVKLAKVQMQYDNGNYLQALNGLNDLIRKDQSQPVYYILRGKIGLKAERIQLADEDFGMALDLNPIDADANLGKGMARFKMQDNTSACYYWQKATHQGSREAKENLIKYCKN